MLWGPGSEQKQARFEAAAWGVFASAEAADSGGWQSWMQIGSPWVMWGDVNVWLETKIITVRLVTVSLALPLCWGFLIGAPSAFLLSHFLTLCKCQLSVKRKPSLLNKIYRPKATKKLFPPSFAQSRCKVVWDPTQNFIQDPTSIKTLLWLFQTRLSCGNEHFQMQPQRGIKQHSVNVTPAHPPAHTDITLASKYNSSY